MEKSNLSAPYYRPTKAELPQHSRLLTTGEVLKFQLERANRAPKEHAWPFSHGNWILTSAAGVSSVVMLVGMRRTFKLGGRGLPWSLVPTIGMSVMPNYLSINLVVSYDILTGQYNKCAECAQIRACGLQLFTGIVYPLIVTQLVTYGMVKKFQTVPLPPFYPFREFKMNFVKYLVRPVLPIMAISAVAQTALAFYIVGKQFDSFVWLMNQDDALVHTR